MLLEYSAYRLFNLITPLSFRARLANIDYLDDSGRPYVSRVGFFIEDFSDVAKRNGMDVAHMGSRVPRHAARCRRGRPLRRLRIYDQQLRLVDARRPEGDDCCHNGRLLSAVAGAPLMPIPYDFDYSGLVDAPYAARPKAFQSIMSGSAPIAAIAPTWRRRGPSPLNWPRAARSSPVCLQQSPASTRATRAARRAYIQGFFSDLDSGKIFKTCIKLALGFDDRGLLDDRPPPSRFPS